MEDTIRLKYVGPYDEVEVPTLGITAAHGVVVELPVDVMRGSEQDRAAVQAAVDSLVAQGAFERVTPAPAPAAAAPTNTGEVTAPVAPAQEA